MSFDHKLLIAFGLFVVTVVLVIKVQNKYSFKDTCKHFIRELF